MAKKLTKLDDVLGDEIPKLFKITKASITDDFCNYSFEITDGIGIGDTHSVKGKGIIHDDLRAAFNQLNVHLGVIDDAFENEGLFENPIVSKFENPIPSIGSINPLSILPLLFSS